MKISAKTRYGLRLMTELGALFDRGPVSIRDVARSQNLSEKYLNQIVTPLKYRGLVSTRRGMRGGVELSRHPARIGLGEIVEALEGDEGLLRASYRDVPAGQAAAREERDIWNLLDKIIAGFMRSYTLEDLVQMRAGKDETAFDYAI